MCKHYLPGRLEVPVGLPISFLSKSGTLLLAWSGGLFALLIKTYICSYNTAVIYLYSSFLDLNKLFKDAGNYIGMLKLRKKSTPN